MSAIAAGAHYDGRILQPVDVARSIFAGGTTRGGSRVGVGDLILQNADGALDYLLIGDYGFDGRTVTVWWSDDYAAFLANVTVYDPTISAERTLHFASGSGLTTPNTVDDSDYDLVFYGTMEQAEFPRERARIRLKDRQYELTVPLQTTKYAGDNALPAGLEGVAADLKGKPKPVCYGSPLNVPAPCVNTSTLTYQVNDGAVSDIPAVYDRGDTITKGADYATSALLQAAAPGAGTYITCFAEGYFRLGSPPGGLVTADVVQGATEAERTAAQIFSQLLNRAAAANPNLIAKGTVSFVTNGGVFMVTDGGLQLVLSSDVSGSDLVALDLANDSVLGFWAFEEMTVGAACDQVLDSVGAWWGVNREGVFRTAQFTAPSGTPVLTVTANDMVKPLERIATADSDKGLPIYRSTVRWGRVYAVQDTDLAAAVTDARRGVVSKEWREAVATDTSIQAAHLFAPGLTEDSLLTVEADAQDEANRRLALRKVRRDRYEVVLALTSETRAIDIGDVIEIVHPRFGLSLVGSDDGALFRVLDVRPDAKARTLTLSVWGKATGQMNLVTDSGQYFVTNPGTYLVTAAA